MIAAIRVFHFLKSAVTDDSVFANANAVAPFANSEGCIPNSPIPNQDFAPFVSEPITKTETNISMKIPYII